MNPAEKKTILVVDDIPDNIQILDEILHDEYRVRAALNGLAALELAQANPPDLILLDVSMPDMDGLTVCKKLKADESLKGIPVIFVTARGETVDEEAGFRAGAADYFTRPVSPIRLLARIRTHITLYERNRNLEELVSTGVERYRLETEQRKKAQKSLARTSSLLLGMMENVSAAIVSVDTKSHISFANTAFSHMLNRTSEDFFESPVSDYFQDKDGALSEALEKAMQSLEHSFLELQLKTEGQKRLLETRVSPLIRGKRVDGAVLVAEDVTQHRMLERQLQQSGKMATLGEMATGIAHEINQPLSVIRMASQMITKSLSRDKLDKEFLQTRADKIMSMVDRAARIINHLRTFGRRAESNFSNLDPNRPVHEALELLTEKIRLNSIHLKLELTEQLPLIKGNSANLEQVLLNLIINSIDAFDEFDPPDGRRIVIRTSYLPEDNLIEILVSDNGPGIPPEVSAQIFDPFFTTKEVGKGTGLGLSISYGIIEAHDGRILIVSQERGAGFSIRIPAVNQGE